VHEQRERDHREDERRAHERGAVPPADDDFSRYLVSTRWNCSQMPITSSCRMFILRWYSRSSVCLSSVATTDERVQPSVGSPPSARSPSSPQTVGVLSRTGIGRPGGRGSLQHVELGVHHSALGWSRCVVTTIGQVAHRMRALSISVCRAGTHACQRLLEAAPAKAWRQIGPVVRNLRTRMRRAREAGPAAAHKRQRR